MNRSNWNDRVEEAPRGDSKAPWTPQEWTPPADPKEATPGTEWDTDEARPDEWTPQDPEGDGWTEDDSWDPRTQD